MNTGSILLIDSDLGLTQLLSKFLEQEGFSVEAVNNSLDGIKKALNHSFDAIVMDIMLPKPNGFEVLKSLREQSQTPVLLFSMRANDVDKMLAFDLGADDYLQKPCSPRELVARLQAILRRTKREPVQKTIIERDNITLDGTKRQVTYKGVDLELTNTEFNILEMLLKSPGQAFSKEELTEYALGRKYTAFDRSIDVHISNLRNKLGDNPEGVPLVKTVRGFGYILDV